MNELPIQFLKNMEQLLGNQYESFLNSFEQESIKGVRLNTKKTDIKTLENILDLHDKIPFTDGFYIKKEERLGNSPFHHAGLFYLQEPSAMQPVLCTSIKEDATVLDLCASPGGKSGQIAEILGENGLLVSNEIITQRATVLKENMDRLSYKNVIVTSTPPENLKRVGAIFDVILVDAPCSGEGLFRRDSSACVQWNENINKMNSERQLSLLNIATSMLKPNGKIIYSTCTFSKVENEDVVQEFLNSHSDFKLSPINETMKKYSTSLILDNCQRVFPNLHKGEGQFYCCLENTNEKAVDNKHYSYLEKLKQSEKKIVQEFVNKYTTLDIENIKSYQGNIILPPKKEINTKGIFVLKYGVNLGKIEKNRFIPHHNFFTSLSEYFKTQINFDNESDILKYLSGEQLEIDDTTISGYVVIKYKGFALGGGKAQGGKVNNLYPKYLRIHKRGDKDV